MSAQEILKETGTRKDASMRHFTGSLDFYLSEQVSKIWSDEWMGLIVLVNFGPQHPAAHGVLRLILELNGEVRSAQS